MIRIMIVDDEPIIRAGLSRVIPWDSLGCEVVAIAENGEAALAQIDTAQPDIVISDIKMPRMDGLELMRILHERRMGCRGILITGYKEFDYARRAVKYGVREYVLKPVDQDQLTESLKKLVEEIRCERDVLREHEQLRERMHESMPLLRDKFLSDLLFRRSAGTYSVRDRLNYFGIGLRRFVVAQIVPDDYPTLTRNWTEDDRLILTYLIADQLQSMAAETGRDVVTCIQEEQVYAFIDCGEDQDLHLVLDFCAQLAQNVYDQGHFNVSIGVSSITDDPSRIRRARHEAERCIAHCGGLGGACVMCIDDIGAPEESGDPMDFKDWIAALKSGAGMDEALEAMMSVLRVQEDTVAVKAAITEILMTTMRVFGAEYGSVDSVHERFQDTLQGLYNARSVREYCDLLDKNCRLLCEQVRQKNASRNNRIMEVARAYMEQNSDREVTLEEVASRVYLSKWYFSKLFKKEVGQNFNEYMNRLRIERAKKLLRDEPHLKNYEIAERLGFSNTRYFAQLFKSMTGTTPTEFRG